MNLHNLIENQSQLIKEFAEELSEGDVRHISYEINWLVSKAEHNAWDTFEDAYMERISEKQYSDRTKKNKKYYFSCIYRKLYPGAIFMERIHHHHYDPMDMFRNSKGYQELNSVYRDLLENYICLAKKEGKKRDTIFVHCSLTSVFLRYLQGKDADNLYDATEKCIMSFFYADNKYEQQIRSYSYKEKLAVVFKTCSRVEKYVDECNRILHMIPSFKYVRKNVKYLTSVEIEAIRNTIDSDRFSLMERAVMMLLLYTGMRSCDVATIKLCDVNWEAETISIIQQKTEEPLEIAMLPAVGNAIFEYLCKLRLSTPSDYLFPGKNKSANHISAVTVRNIAGKAYKLAEIRQSKGVRKGTHLFRHHVATKMLENGVDRSVISKTLGHMNPDSLVPYLHADFKHLSEFGLSLSAYPVSERVWNI